MLILLSVDVFEKSWKPQTVGEVRQVPDDVSEEAAVLRTLKQLIAPRYEAVTRALFAVFKNLLHKGVFFYIIKNDFGLLCVAGSLAH